MTTGKTIALTRHIFVGKVKFLLFNTLSRFVIAFLPRSKHLLISWLQSPSTMVLESKKIKFVTVSIVFPSICHEVMGLDAMIMTISCPPPCSLPTLGPSKVHGKMHSFKIHVGLCLQLGSTTYCVTLDKLLKFSELQSGI